jgi:16S rRNA processing protein RimM
VLGQQLNDNTNAAMVILGRISGIFGVRGWIKVYSDTSPRDNILGYSPWFLGRSGHWQKRRLLEGRLQGRGLVARVEGCSDRDQAAELVDMQIAVPRDQLPPTDEGEYYWSDLQGLRVETVQGVDLGHVDHLFETGSNDVLVVKDGRERLIPFLQESVIRRIDLHQRVIIVDWDPDF